MSRLFSLAFIFALVAIACVRAQEDVVGIVTASNASQPSPPPQASPVPEAEPVPQAQPIISPLQENKTEELAEKMVNLGVKNLKLRSYMGGWFLIAVSKHIKDAVYKDCVCARGLHKQINETAFTATYSCLNKTTNDISIVHATLNSLNLTNAGLYSMKFDKLPSQEKEDKIDSSDSTSKYIILKSYKFGKDGNYRLSLVGSPSEKGVYLQSRSKRISKNTLRKLNAYVLDNKISDSPLARVQQERCEMDYQLKKVKRGIFF